MENTIVAPLPSLKDYAFLSGLFNKIPLRKLIGEGNLKVPRTTAIFNMASATDCPSLKRGLCMAYVDGKHVCYARKAEYSYHPGVLPYRRRQEKLWLNTSAEDFAAQFLIINTMKKNKFTAIRFNESGDFHSQDCVTKTERIARILSKYGIKSYLYTSRMDLDFRKCEKLVVNGSGFLGRGVTNTFQIVKQINNIPKGFRACVGDCRICSRCMNKGMKTVIKKH